MSALLDPVRSVIPASARKRFYDISTAVIAALVLWGYLGASEVPVWSSLVVSVITLLFAVLYASTPVRVAFYLALVAASAVFTTYGVLDDARWSAILAIVAQVLGTAVAGSNTPIVDAESTVVRDTEF